jgi:protein-tyrosine-phosphatase
MAEGFARKWLENNQIKGWEVMSAGTFAGDKYPTSLETENALREHGVDFDGSSTPLTKALVDRAAIILCMTPSHCVDVASIAEDPTKIEMFNVYGGITDPVGCDQSVYDELAREMLHIIPKRLSEIVNRNEQKE